MRTIESSFFSPFESSLLPSENLSRHAFSLCGGPCAGLFLVENSEMLETLIRCCIKAGYPYKTLGGMTNILISDDGFDGIVLLNRKGKVSHVTAEDGSVILTAESGAGMGTVVRYCIENEISGMEWAAGLPGTVGGAVRGNAGAFGTEISDIFAFGSMLDENGKCCELIHKDLNFDYRTSTLKTAENELTLLNASFLLFGGHKEEIAARCEENREKRRNTQPINEHSLGSVFKNPEGESAGKLIQAAGLKGVSIGNATVSMKHANFITTTNGVTSREYHRLVVYVQNTVYEQFRVLLEPEIELFGFGG